MPLGLVPRPSPAGGRRTGPQGSLEAASALWAEPLSCLRTQGYLFISVLVNSNSELIRLINNAVKNDLASRNPTFMGLALHCIANVGSREMGEAFAADIPRILVAG